MITTIDYISWFDNKKKEMIASGRYLSEIKFLFKEDSDEFPEFWEFNTDNWNGGDILRHFLVDHFWEDINLDGYEVRYYLINDQTTVFILGDSEFYEISWYKSRGRTEKINKNGMPIDLEDYLELCNKLGVELR